MPIGAEVERPRAAGTAWLRRFIKEFGRTLLDAVLLQQPPVMTHQELEMVVEQAVQTLVNVAATMCQLLRIVEDFAQLVDHGARLVHGDLEAVHVVRNAFSKRARVGHDRHDACPPRLGNRQDIGFGPDRKHQRDVARRQLFAGVFRFVAAMNVYVRQIQGA